MRPASPPPPAPATPLVRLREVSYQYPQSTRLALCNLTLDVQRGEILGVIGQTGAGKTTLCRTLNGILPQLNGGRFFGHITVDGLDTLEHAISTLATRVGQVFEDPETQLIATSIENEIAFALENLRVPRAEMRVRIDEVLELTRLAHVRHKSPQELSGGQKQRLAIAAALAVRPALLVLDEPTSQLDPIGTFEIFATLRELNRKLGMTIVIVSHAAEDLAETAHRVALLHEGQLVALGSPHALFGEVERLAAHQVRPPQVAQVFSLLSRSGHHPPEAAIPIRLDEGARALRQLVQVSPPTPFVTPDKGSPALGPAVLEASDLSHTYQDGTPALCGLHLRIARGEYVVLVGQNGAGKSTLLRHFLRLLEPTSGQVRVLGQSVTQLSVSDIARRIGYIAQNPDQQIFSSTVRGEVEFALHHQGFSKADLAARVDEALHSMGLSAFAAHHPLSLPKGDRARVVIAAVLAMQPEILIFDEPTTGQDLRGAHQILDLTRRLHQAGKTIVVVTHHLYLMPSYGQRLVVMGQGSLLLDAPLRAAYHQIDVLSRTYLLPPQTVLLAKELSPPLVQVPHVLTPSELASLFPPPAGGRAEVRHV